MTTEAKSRLQSDGRQSNTGYHQTGKTNWWARLTSGGSRSAVFLDIPRVRGDEYLDVIVAVPPGTKVFIGAGRGAKKTIRETVVTTPIE